MKTALTLCFVLLSLCSMAQDYKVEKEIANIFVDRKSEWSAAKKMDYHLMSWSNLSVKQSGSKLTLTNKNDKPYHFDQPTNKSYEQECWEYTNVKFSAMVTALSEDATKFSGLGVERRSDVSTNTASFKKITTGPKDAFDRTFDFMINNKGDVAILKIKKDDQSVQTLFKLDEAKDYKAGVPNLISLERKGLTWNFFLNDVMIFTHRDNSFGALSNLYFVTDAQSKGSYEAPSITYFDNAFVPYERITTGTTTYKDNECRFKVLEGNIEKLCPSAEQNSEHLRYLSTMCYSDDTPLQFGIIFFRNGEKTTNPLSEFLETYAKELYGGQIDETAFKSQRVKYLKENEAVMVKQLKESFLSRNKGNESIVFSDLVMLTVGNNEGRYFDINYEESGAAQLRRMYYTYTPAGLMIIQFDTVAGGLAGNKVYDQIVQNVVTF